MSPTDRLSLALLRMRITRALQEMRAACELWNLDAAQRAEREMNDGLDQLGKRLGAAG